MAADTWRKAPPGGLAWPAAFLPQQARVPSALTPQLWKFPAETWLKDPLGGLAWPSLLEPQQTAVVSVLIPQVWVCPADTWLYDPTGTFSTPKPLSPQHTAVAPPLMPQLCPVPALIELQKATGGTVAAVEPGAATAACAGPTHVVVVNIAANATSDSRRHPRALPVGDSAAGRRPNRPFWLSGVEIWPLGPGRAACRRKARMLIGGRRRSRGWVPDRRPAEAASKAGSLGGFRAVAPDAEAALTPLDSRCPASRPMRSSGRWQCVRNPAYAEQAKKSMAQNNQ